MSRHSAFTLMEALIVLTLISILSLLAFPGLRAITAHAQDNAVRDEIVRLIQHARSQAALLRQSVTLCKSSDLQQCGGKWSDGQIVFVDQWLDGRIHESTQVIAVNRMQNDRGNLHARFYPVYREVMRFNPITDEYNDNGTFWYCRQNDAKPAWALQVNRAGSINLLKPDNDGVIADSKGKTLAC